MLAKTFSFTLTGLDACLIAIEVDVGKGLPQMSIVGLPDSAVKESRERVRAAVRNSGFVFPSGRITINLAPADMKKEGPAFDLAIALGVLAASDQLPKDLLKDMAILGELSLDGTVKAIPGALAAAISAGGRNLKWLVVPAANASEASLSKTIPIFAATSLLEIARTFQEDTLTEWPEAMPDAHSLPEDIPDFQEVKGHSRVKRGLEVAAAGSHNLLLIGPPGSGKTMLASRFPSILPGMSQNEILDVTRVYSAAGLFRASALLSNRPFRAPHHNASHAALVGGGSDPRPGEVTLAHRGVLFLDELPEFNRPALESLRQPLEDGSVTVARASRTLSFPAQFSLLAAMNPCPCGHLFDRKKKCRCSSEVVQRYLGKISGPLLDRIDIHLDVPALDARELRLAETGESSEVIRTRVEAARRIQEKRFAESRTGSNSRMRPREIRKFAALSNEGENLLEKSVENLGLSARAHDRILRVARTIADLAQSERIQPDHLAEAISYRVLDKIRM